MSRVIIISNRLPVTVKKNNDGTFEYSESIGGLTTGVKSYHEQADSIWVGWPGISDDGMSDEEREEIQKTLLEEYKCFPVFLSEKEMDQFYFGFCNRTIWPLFHYFSSKTEYDFETWEAYEKVNQKFLDAISLIMENEDIIWVHDYQLMLLPQMVRQKYPYAHVGFFLHIPFPSYEIFRLLVWREEILYGLLGADLIGFHTYDYVRHFLSSTCRLLGLEDKLNKISYEDRYVRVEAFPMGIDYDRFSKEYEDKDFEKDIIDIGKIKNMKMILSVDRLDYTKGIPERINSFRRFLALYPEYRGKVRLNLIVAPSRAKILNYDILLKEIKELVSETNGLYGTLKWMPIWFLYRTFSQKNLIALYRNSEVMLVTPLRDGMNLVAKEYIAARTDYDGMIVVSETAGAASELAEAVIVNPNDYGSVAQGIKNALDMPQDEKIVRNKIMHKRLKRYNIKFWAADFLSELERTVADSQVTVTQLSAEENRPKIEGSYQNAKKRILFLDYDGTLVGFSTIPEQAKPDAELIGLLTDLTQDPKNTVVVISGRDRHTLEKWFSGISGLHLIASHGLWLRNPDRKKWLMTAALDNKWKDSIRPILELYSDRMPGSLIEEKDFSLSLHYRRCDPDMVGVKLSEVKETLISMIKTSTLMLQEGSKVLEIKDSRVNKGTVTSLLVKRQEYDFVFGVGDDFTDEDIFLALPKDAFSTKIGLGETNARYRMKSWQSMRVLLRKFAEISKGE